MEYVDNSRVDLARREDNSRSTHGGSANVSLATLLIAPAGMGVPLLCTTSNISQCLADVSVCTSGVLTLLSAAVLSSNPCDTAALVVL